LWRRPEGDVRPEQHYHRGYAASVAAAAKILGIDVTTLQRKRKRYGLA
jgi:hypothetical protein